MTGDKRAKAAPFSIVGLGASAGGLEALEAFLKHVPRNSGMAFVIVQHLDPTHKGIMPELLQRATSMDVHQVTDQMKIEPNRVYVIPPNAYMSVLRGVLHLFTPTESRGVRLPIDFFLRSLAEDRKERSIGIILSGMGSDGTLGLRAIKERAGLALVQDPASAKFEMMPRSVIDAGLADVVAAPEELAERIIQYSQRFPRHVEKGQEVPIKGALGAIEKITILLRNETGHDFSQYKKSTFLRRIERRMAIHQINELESYVRYLQGNPQELNLLFKELLIGVTNFFRDPQEWALLQKEVLPQLLARRSAGMTLRAWSVGCSTGEEAYSLAIAFREAASALPPEAAFTLQVFATDLDAGAIEKARQGLYPNNIAEDVSPDLLRRYFVKEGESYRVRKDIREMVTFAVQNVISDPPFIKLDLLLCRNLLIYLTSELQKKLLPLFHYALRPDGVLFLGTAESRGQLTDLFVPVAPESRMFRRLNTSPVEPVEFPAAGLPAGGAVGKPERTVFPAANLQSLADQVLLRHFSPCAVLVSEGGDIVYISGKVGAFLEIASGKANLNIFAMAREGLRHELATAFSRALRQQEPVTVKAVKFASDGRKMCVDLSVQFLTEPEPLRGLVLVVFNERPVQRERRVKLGGTVDAARVGELEDELQSTREALQSSREEMQTSQEELKSVNEELQSTNEELQSTNEELTTSKEELQSMNEELQTVNMEQKEQLEKMSVMNNDMSNLLNSTDIPTVFLDSRFNVRRFTPGATKLFKLMPVDVGRPLSDLVTSLVYPEMLEDATEVVRTLAFREKQVMTANGRWFTVRILPYRSVAGIIDGVVMTFTDISTVKKLEAERLRSEKMIRSVIEALRCVMVCISRDWKIMEFNIEAERVLGCRRDDVVGKNYLELFVPEQTREKVAAEMEKLFSGQPGQSITIALRIGDGTVRNIRWFASRLQEEGMGEEAVMVAIGTDAAPSTGT